MSKINTYKYLTDEEVDKYSAMDIEDFKAEIQKLKSDPIKKVIPFSGIDKNRPFVIRVQREDAEIRGSIYVKRGGKMYEVTPYGENERRISLHSNLEHVMYLYDKRKLTELYILLHFMLFKPQGGSKYCIHEFSIGLEKCPHCGAVNL